MPKPTPAAAAPISRIAHQEKVSFSGEFALLGMVSSVGEVGCSDGCVGSVDGSVGSVGVSITCFSVTVTATTLLYVLPPLADSTMQM